MISDERTQEIAHAWDGDWQPWELPELAREVMARRRAMSAMLEMLRGAVTLMNAHAGRNCELYPVKAAIALAEECGEETRED
jgi:cytosine/adenosine deaminase-related metal-dependent hydrolase